MNGRNGSFTILEDGIIILEQHYSSGYNGGDWRTASIYINGAKIPAHYDNHCYGFWFPVNKNDIVELKLAIQAQNSNILRFVPYK